MACLEAPGLTIEKRRLIDVIGGTFLGIVGDAQHSFGYHLCLPAGDDYSTAGAANRPVGSFSAAIDVGMNWPASRAWLRWLIREIREDRITGIAEVIGSYDGKNVRYWSDADGWGDAGVPYGGSGHDTWTHVAIYRSTAKVDHGILKGWSANGNGNNNPGGVEMELGTVVPSASEYDSAGKMTFARTVEHLLVDDWRANHGVSQDTLATVKAMATKIDALKPGQPAPVDITALVAALKPAIIEVVRAELAKLTLKNVQ